MQERNILEIVTKTSQDFGVKCKKFSGTLTVELIRQALLKKGFNVSERDVFIKGIPVEIDLLIYKKGISSENRVLYKPEDVLVILEVKRKGTFGEFAIKSIMNNFKLIKQRSKNINCIYVTLTERKNYKWKATEQNINSPVFTLFWHSGPENNMKYENTRDWKKLINYLNKITNTV
jgi:UDP-N-acetylglucosamine 2-epimerase